MRSKGALDSETSGAKEWQLETGREVGMKSVEVINKNGQREYQIHSVSGNERNKLFINREGKSFVDVSAFSGADSKADSRVVAYSDLNHDGFQDLLVVNGNNPHLEIFANRYPKTGGNFLAVKLTGGNENSPSKAWSNRDGIGAVVNVSAGNKMRSRELRCGEGFAAQNSNTLIFGLADLTTVDQIEVRWPSGKVQRCQNVDSNQIVAFNERKKVPTTAPWKDSYDFPKSKQKSVFNFDTLIDSKDHQLRVFTTLETTCASCRASVDEFGSLVADTKGLPVAFFALPTDPQDSESDIEDYVAATKPVYQVLALNPDDRAAHKELVTKSMKIGVSPSYMITDSEGRLLYLESDMPTISDVRRLLHRLNSANGK